MSQIKGCHQRKGFTLIELMIVVAIIGILAAIAIPKFAEMIRKSKEGAVKGNLGSLRGALNIYYADMEGQYPNGIVTQDALASLTYNGKYLSVVPLVEMPPYHSSTNIELDSNLCTDTSWAIAGDPARWTFCNLVGRVVVGCLHTDSKGTVWTTY